MKNETRRKMGLGPAFKADYFPSKTAWRTVGLHGAWATVTYDPRAPKGMRWVVSTPDRQPRGYASRGAARQGARYYLTRRGPTPAAISAAMDRPATTIIF